MIAVISMKSTDDSTIRVMEWIKCLGGESIRINVDDIPRMGFGLEPEGAGGGSFVTREGHEVPLSEIHSVWFRRSAPMPLPDLSPVTNDDLRKVMERHMLKEYRGAATGLYSALDHAHWLSHPDTCVPSKFQVLKKAHALGIHIPPSLITNNKRTLLDFRAKHGELILKCITDADIFEKDETMYSTFTNVFESDHIDSLPDRFFPVLIQKKIEKAWEIRSFYLEPDFHTMAIFSQGNKKTEVDFRHYDLEKPNRNIPYDMGADLEGRLTSLMKQLSLNSGSLDLICGKDGKTYFLEVNPVGMFGMVSVPCNLNLRKKVAEYLIEKDKP